MLEYPNLSELTLEEIRTNLQIHSTPGALRRAVNMATQLVTLDDITKYPEIVAAKKSPQSFYNDEIKAKLELEYKNDEETLNKKLAESIAKEKADWSFHTTDANAIKYLLYKA